MILDIDVLKHKHFQQERITDGFYTNPSQMHDEMGPCTYIQQQTEARNDIVSRATDAHITQLRVMI